jgi:diadenosine tetraphosphate (Ap4A) HIT family hydrolase
MTRTAWPVDWAERLGGKECRLCAELGHGDTGSAVSVTTGAYTEVFLDRRPQAPGHAIVVWRHGHVAEPTELDAAGVDGYWREVVLAATAVQRLYRPLKMNIMTLGNDTPHLHTRVVTRYWQDPAPGGPLPWDLIHASEPLGDDDLRRQAAAFRDALVELGF